jgi:hypothetical protein
MAFVPAADETQDRKGFPVFQKTSALSRSVRAFFPVIHHGLRFFPRKLAGPGAGEPAGEAEAPEPTVNNLA